MAFVLQQHKSEFGVLHPAAYANIDSYIVNLNNQTCKVNVTIYADLQSRLDQKTPIGVKTYYIQGEEFRESLETVNFILRDTIEIPEEELEVKEGITNASTSNMYMKLQGHKDFLEAIPIFEVSLSDKRKEVSMKEAAAESMVLNEDYEVKESLGE